MYVSLFFSLWRNLNKKKENIFQSVYNRNLRDSSRKKPVFSHPPFFFFAVLAVAVVVVVEPIHFFSIKSS